MAELVLNSSSGQKLMSYLPGYYGTSRIMGSLMDAEGSELDRLRQALDELLSQYFVNSATWGLDLWESELGITTDETKPVEQRRSMILSKIRGIGTVTADLIKSVAESYANGVVAVENNYAGYTVTITFVSRYGVPPNMKDIQEAIRDVLPAHLAVQYVYRYYTYNQLIASGKTYAQTAAATYDQLYNGGLI